MSANPSPSIYEKVIAISEAVPYIQRDTDVKDRVSFRAVSHDNVIAKLGPLLNQHKLLTIVSVLPETINIQPTPSGKMVLFTAVFECKLLCAESKHSIDVLVPGSGADFMDKAPGKAASYATKTWLLKLFHIETGENEESAHPGPADLQAQNLEFDDAMKRLQDCYEVAAVRSLWAEVSHNFTAKRRGEFQAKCAARVKLLQDQADARNSQESQE